MGATAFPQRFNVRFEFSVWLQERDVVRLHERGVVWLHERDVVWLHG
jgi:hypothetical protein